MKTNSSATKLASVAALICGLDASTAAWGQNLYLTTELGGTLVNDVTIKNAGGIQATFDPGVGGTVCLGYRIAPAWAVEFETGVLWNSFDKIGGVTLESMHASADLYQIPFKLNVIYSAPTKGRWTPYIGAGAGGMATILEGSVDPVPGPAPASVSVIGNENFCDIDLTFAYQAVVGLRYRLSPHAQVDVGYKFFGTLDHSWRDRGRDFKTEAIYTHAFLASFTWSF